MYETISFQMKFINGVIASVFGRRYPFINFMAVELSVLTLLHTAKKRTYCNVHLVRLGFSSRMKNRLEHLSSELDLSIKFQVKFDFF